jgi:hypothetical protein
LRSGSQPEPFSAVFFEIGGTRVVVRESEGTKPLELFATIFRLLQILRGTLGLRLEVI